MIENILAIIFTLAPWLIALSIGAWLTDYTNIFNKLLKKNGGIKQ